MLGHIAHTDRTGRITAYVATLQHSAEIHKGNSGGPLINSKGDVVGINTYLLLPDQEMVWYSICGAWGYSSSGQLIK